MSLSRGVGWATLVVWSAWMLGMQGLFAASKSAGAWTPDLGVVLLLAIDPKLDRTEARLAAVIVAASRIAYSSDPPLAILVGYLGVVGLSHGLRTILEVDHVLPRTLLAGLCTLLLSFYWTVARDGGYDPSAAHELAASWMWSTAFTTALTTLLFSAFVVRLPGLSPLLKRRR